MPLNIYTHDPVGHAQQSSRPGECVERNTKQVQHLLLELNAAVACGPSLAVASKRHLWDESQLFTNHHEIIVAVWE